MTRYRQIVTLGVDFDPAKFPPPADWMWGELAAALGGGIDVKVLASGPPERVDTSSYERLKDTLALVDMALSQHSDGSKVAAMRIAANGPTIGEVVGRALTAAAEG